MMTFNIPAKALEDHFASALYAMSLVNDNVDITKITFGKFKVNKDGTIPIEVELSEVSDDASPTPNPIGFLAEHTLH